MKTAIVHFDSTNRKITGSIEHLLEWCFDKISKHLSDKHDYKYVLNRYFSPLEVKLQKIAAHRLPVRNNSKLMILDEKQSSEPRSDGVPSINIWLFCSSLDLFAIISFCRFGTLDVPNLSFLTILWSHLRNFNIPLHTFKFTIESMERHFW